MRILIILFLLLLASCVPEKESKTRTDVGGLGDIYTTEHDGHKWVIFSSNYKGGIAHHPDCEHKNCR